MSFTEKVFTLGPMVVFTPESMSRTKSMDRAVTSGQMGVA